MALMTPESTDDHQVNAAELDHAQLATWKDQFVQHPTAGLMQNAVTQNGIDDVALDRQVVTTTDHTFSHFLDDWSVTTPQFDIDGSLPPPRQSLSPLDCSSLGEKAEVKLPH